MVVFLSYLGLYTWNLRTGTLDKVAGNSALELVGAVFKPGQYMYDRVFGALRRYVFLVNVERKNEALEAQLSELRMALQNAQAGERELLRLRRLHELTPPQEWNKTAARVLTRHIGPAGVLDSLMLDKGSATGAAVDTAVATEQGIVGRVMRASAFTSTVHLIVDRASHISVMGQDSRSVGILSGNGVQKLLSLEYVPLNASLQEGELLVTTGFAGLFPKDMPVARVVSIERSELALFLTVYAEAVADLNKLEEVLLLQKMADGANAPAETDAPADVPTDKAAGIHTGAHTGKAADAGATPKAKADAIAKAKAKPVTTRGTAHIPNAGAEGL